VTEVERSDAELVSAFRRTRDEVAFDALYARHSPALFRLALAATNGERADAEDLLHDTWITAVDRLHGFEGRSALRTWLTGILLNKARQWRRSPTRRWDPIDTAEMGVSPSPPDPADRADIERALASVPARARMILILHDAHGHTHSDIAGMLGINAGTSKSQLFRARRVIAAILADPETADHAK
jgi:RNA polymerase sigma-70 factor, ECF subfamily